MESIVQDNEEDMLIEPEPSEVQSGTMSCTCLIYTAFYRPGSEED